MVLYGTICEGDLPLSVNRIEPDFKRVKRAIWYLDVECLVGGV